MNLSNKIFTGAALLFLFVSNAFAFGDGMNIGGLQVNPSVMLYEQYDDNITRAESRIVSSRETIINSTIDIIAGGKINQLNIHYGFERGHFANSSNDSYSDHLVNGALHYELTSKAVVETMVFYAKSHDARGATFSGIATGFNTPDRWHEAAATARFSYGGPGATGRIELNGGFSARRYVNHRSLTAGRDLNAANAGATFYYRITPQASALFEGDYDNFDYRLANSPLDSHQLTLYTGLTWEATGKTTGTVKAGWQRKKFKRSNQSGSSFFSLDAQIAWAPLTYSTWTLNAGSIATETDSNGISGSYIKTKNALLGWAHHWNERLSHTAHAGYMHDSYIGTLRRDDSVTAGVSLTYDIAPWLGVGIAYEYEKRTSNVVNAAYQENIYSLNMKGDL